MNTKTEDRAEQPLTETAVLAREMRRNEMAQMKFGDQGGGLMVPTDGRDLQDKANLMAQSGFMVRDIYRGNPGACAALIMICAPYKLNPFQASWKTYKASKSDDAPISFEAQLVTAMVNVGAPIKDKLKPTYEGEGVKRKCTVRATDAESGEVLEYESPEIGQISPKNSPLWKSDPDQQLFYFASRAWCRRHYPQILLGVYARDEIEEDRTPRGPDQAVDVTPAAQSLKERIARQQAQQDAMWAPPSDEEAAGEPENAEGGDTTPEAEIATSEPENEPDDLLGTDVTDEDVEDAEIVSDTPALSEEEEARIRERIEAEHRKAAAEVAGKDDLFDEG